MPRRLRTPPIPLAGVIPYRHRNGVVEIALITTRNGNRWIVPKGRIGTGETARDAAVREAHEEAGLAGVLDPDPIGTFEQRKNGTRHATELYALAVLRSLKVWPERSWRKRRWFEASEAAKLVHHDDLARCIRDLIDRLRRDRSHEATA
ncbi:MAG: NUDIX hydrolase [Planctomycetes bacterium]|nr:NUDIX hydrolase [Planctomycetota bacterium]